MFIELETVWKLNRKKVLVNVNQILWFAAGITGTDIQMADANAGVYLSVIEDYETVKKMVMEATNND